MKNIKNNDWIINDGIVDYIDDIYSLASESVADYGYLRRFKDPEKLVGRASEMVEYMVVFPIRGQEEKFATAAKKMGVDIQPDTLKAPGAVQPGICYLFDIQSQMNINNKIFRQILRRAVKDRQAHQAMMVQAARIQSQR